MVQKPHTEHCPSLFNEGFVKKHWSIGVFPSMDQRAAAHFVYCCCPCKSGILSVFAYCSWPCKVGILFVNYKNLKALKSLVAPRTVPQSSFNRAFGRHFLLRVRGPHHLNFQGVPSKIWRVPPLKYITNSPILGGSLGPQAKFYKGPIGFSGDRDPYLRPPRALLQCHQCQGGSHIDDPTISLWLILISGSYQHPPQHAINLQTINLQIHTDHSQPKVHDPLIWLVAYWILWLITAASRSCWLQQA